MTSSPPGPVHVHADGDAQPAGSAGEQLVQNVREQLEAAGGFEELAQRMSLLADPRRLRILFSIHAAPGLRSTEVARVIGASGSTTSHALALLRAAGWVRADRSGREVRYHLADDGAHRLLHELGSQHLPGVRHGAPDHL